MARSFTITQDGEARSFTLQTGVGPIGATGATGPAPAGTGIVSVTGGVLDSPTTLSARVSADASNLRTQLGLGNAATMTVDADLATFALPASTTISTFGASLIDDATAGNARTTLGAAATSHTHVSADVTDATSIGGIVSANDANKLVKLNDQGYMILSGVNAFMGTSGVGGAIRATGENSNMGTDYGYLYARDSLKFTGDPTAGVVPIGTLTTSALNVDRTWTFPDASGTIALTSNITGTNSGTNTGDQTITLTGGVTGSGTGSFAATVVTNANLTGHITSTGNAAVLGSFTRAQLNAAVSDADVAKVDAETHTGAHAFSSTTRPTSGGTGTPAATSLITATDARNAMIMAELGRFDFQMESTDWGLTATLSGAHTTSNHTYTLYTSASAGSKAVVRSSGTDSQNCYWHLGNATQRQVNWAKRTVLIARFCPNSVAGADTEVTLQIGIPWTQTTGAKLLSTQRGIGFYMLDGLIRFIVADASTVTDTSSGVTVTSGAYVYDVMIDSDGVGNWAGYVNGTLATSGTGAPSTLGTAGENIAVASITNGTTASGKDIRWSKITALQIP